MRPHKEWPYRSTSKENDYHKHTVNYFQSWHMGTTNKLLQTALRKRTHSSRQPEVAHCYLSSHSGWEQPGIKSTPALLPNQLLYQLRFRWHRRWYIVGWTVWQIRRWLRWRRQWHVWWHMNRYNRCSVKRVIMMMNFFCFDSILLILVHLIHRFDSRGV